jgi:hypothetical protein
MDSIQKIVDKLSKQKLVAYFLLLWGISFFLDAVDSIAYVILHASTYFPADFALETLINLIRLAISAVLVLLGWKLLKTVEK